MRFVWPEEFERERHDDLLLALLWSFSNNEHIYLYGPRWVDYKYAAHKAIVDNDFKLISKYLTDEITKLLQSKLESLSDWNERRLCWRFTIYQLCKSGMLKDILKTNDLLNAPTSLCRIQNLGRSLRLQNLEHYISQELPFKPFKCDYRDLQVPTDSVIYCDPPYVNTSGYAGADEFDSKAFLDWAAEIGRDNPIYISEYQIDDPRFICVAERTHRMCASRYGASVKIEKLYTVK
jgi:hypothetical protein